MARSKDKRLAEARFMPPLQKRKPDEKYDIRKDEVLKWVMGRPELVNVLVSKLADWGYIRYDPETHTWQGVDYEAD